MYHAIQKGESKRGEDEKVQVPREEIVHVRPPQSLHCPSPSSCGSMQRQWWLSGSSSQVSTMRAAFGSLHTRRVCCDVGEELSNVRHSPLAFDGADDVV